jgi:hypothetical protein
LLQRAQVFGVLRAVGQREVEVARFLPEGEVVLGVDGEGEDRVIAAEDGGRAVALVDVAIDDEDALGKPLRLQRARRDRAVVEQAVALAVFGKGMVGASGRAMIQAVCVAATL